MEWRNVGTASGVVTARTTKRLPPSERWDGSLLEEAHGSEISSKCTGIRSRVELGPELLCCNHAQQFFYLHKTSAMGAIVQNRVRAVWPHRQLPCVCQRKSSEGACVRYIPAFQRSGVPAFRRWGPRGVEAQTWKSGEEGGGSKG